MAGITFDDIMLMRAKEMADRGIKPDNPATPQKGSNNPPVGAIQRRMGTPPVSQEEPTPQQYLRKLPPEIAALAVRYGRI